MYEKKRRYNKKKKKKIKKIQNFIMIKKLNCLKK